MATKNPRISVMLEPEVFKLYQDFAALQGRSMSSVIGEMLTEVSPPIRSTVNLLMVAKDVPKQVLNDLAATFEGTASDMRGVFGDTVNQMDLLLEELQRQALVPPSSNTGATTEPPACTLPESRASRG